MKEILYGIFHTAHEYAKDKFYDFASCDYINTIMVESDYKSEEFAISMRELAMHPDKKVWIAVSYLGFKSVNNATIADNGEKMSGFNPITTMYKDYRERINGLIYYLKKNDWYRNIVGFYMDEPMLWNITNDNLEKFIGYFRIEAAFDKRFFICFSVAGVAPEFWTINNIEPINPQSSRYLTDIAFDMYHKWSNDYLKILKLMLERTGYRKDLKVWMIPCTMNYLGDKTEKHCLDHLNACYEVLKKLDNPGGLMCFTYHTFAHEEETLGNIGMDNLARPDFRFYWPELIERVKEIGHEIIRNNK